MSGDFENEAMYIPPGRPMYEITRDIYLDWKKINYGAVPYLQAMHREDYGLDGEKSIVLYFLANAQTWRGPIAKRIKAELKARIGVR